jgi:hypothetical protein
VHWLRGSWPAGTDEQVPSAPARAHDRQVPVHAPVQQIPCSQKAELHSLADPQVAPIGFLPQLPVMQVLGALQSPLTVQVVRQVPLAPQT